MRFAIVVAMAGAVLAGACGSSGPRTEPNPSAIAIREAVAGGPTVPGGLMNNEVGLSLDEGDRAIGAQAEYRALEYGRAGVPVAWRSSASDNYGEVVVGTGYQVNRLDCREYTHTIYVGGRARVSRGTACRNPSGHWRAVT